MAKKAFDRIMAGLTDAEAFLAGNQEGAVVHQIPAVDVRAIREKVGGSREAFSARFGLDSRAVQDWEQGRRTPDRSTRVLMLMIENEPKVVERVVKKVAIGTEMLRGETKTFDLKRYGTRIGVGRIKRGSALRKSPARTAKATSTR